MKVRVLLRALPLPQIPASTFFTLELRMSGWLHILIRDDKPESRVRNHGVMKGAICVRLL